MRFDPGILDKWIPGKRDSEHGPTEGSKISILPGQCRGFRYFVVVLLSISIGAACIENGLHPLVLLVLPVVVLALFRQDYSRPYIWSERVMPVLFIAYVVLFSAGALLIYGKLTLPKFMVYFAFGILMVRVLSPLTDRNMSQLIALSLSLILINCILTNHIVFGLLLPVYFFALMGTLLLFHLARNSAPTGGTIELPRGRRLAGSWYGKLAIYTLWVIAFTAIMFVFIPRPFFAIPGLRTAMANAGGLAELEKRISYRDMAGMAGRQRIAFKVKVLQGKLPDAPLWRGRVLGRFKNGVWTPATHLRGLGRIVHADPKTTLDYQFLPYRLQSKVIYVCGLPVAALGRRNRPLFITSGAEVIVDSPFLFSDSYFISTVDRPIPTSYRRNPSYVDRTGVTPRIEKLAQDWTGSYSSSRQKASALTARLRSGFRYTLFPPPTPDGVHPLEYFLFESKSGNCEQFSGALCLLLRAVGIPARVVEGFAGVESTDVPDEYIVRFARAHAWVEAMLDRKFWTTLDATPVVDEGAYSRFWRYVVDLYDALEYRWIKQVVYFDRTDQADMMKALGRILTGDFSLPRRIASKAARFIKPAMVLVGLLLSGFIVCRVWRRKPKDWSAIYLKTMKQLVADGILARVHPWHEQNTADIIKRSPGSREAVHQFMTTYFKGRFGPFDDVSIHALEKARQDLLHSVKERSGRISSS